MVGFVRVAWTFMPRRVTYAAWILLTPCVGAAVTAA